VFKVESGQNEHAIVPIGFPITNVQNHVVRETESGDFVHVPTGMIGELLIGGQGVAQGYINQLELEQLKFISCTFGEWTPSTYYRTGDRVRRLENGALEFIGRVDDQVKLRGHRVELGEIEACLLQLAYIKQAHVKVHGESEAEKMLVAYVVADQQIDAEEETLIDLTLSSLAEKLPPYMLPSKVFLVAEFPLDKHGKLDKKALPEPYEQACSQLDDVAQTETEAALLEMWSELFKRDPKSISLTTGFLELGGNSLLILRLLGMLKSRLGLDVDMDVFFKRNSIRVLAETIDAMKKKSELSQKIASLDESESEEVEF
jgi:acyl carrier protein